jgi:hypothetical protein
MADIKYIIPFTYKWEGGLSRATTDSASSNPSPYVHNGQTGWHTNKGITYSTFKSGADKGWYKDNSQNFLTMPEDVWLKIAKDKFWDKIYLSDIKSQAVANVIFSWQWGSGYAWRNRMVDYFKSKGITWNKDNYKNLASNLNELVDKQGEKKTFDELIEQKKQFLLGIGEGSNPGGIYTKGWLNRLEDLKKYSYTLLGKTADVVKKNLIPIALITAIVIISGYVLYTQLKSKNK